MHNYSLLASKKSQDYDRAPKFRIEEMWIKTVEDTPRINKTIEC